jgi:hypothetical protein
MSKEIIAKASEIIKNKSMTDAYGIPWQLMVWN